MSEIREEEVQYGDLFRAADTFDKPVMFVGWEKSKGLMGKNWLGIYIRRPEMSVQRARRGFLDGFWERIDE